MDFFPPYYFPLGLKEAKSKNILSFCSYLQKNKTQQDKLSKVEIMAECNSSTALFTEQRPKESVERRKQYSSKNVSIKNAIYVFYFAFVEWIYVKLRLCEKATKIWKKFPRKFDVINSKRNIPFQILLSSHNILTLILYFWFLTNPENNRAEKI